MWKILGWLNKRLILAIPTLMVFGFVYGLLFPAAGLKQLIVPFTFLMVYPMMVTLKVRTVFERGGGKAQLLAQVINFGVIPFLAFGIGQTFFADKPYMALGLLLAGLVPTSGMTISWTGFAKGNMAAAVRMTVVGLVLGSLATPFYVQFLMGTSIEMSVLPALKQVVLIVFLPMVLGVTTQQLLMKRYGIEAFQKKIAPRFPGFSTVGVLGIVFIALALKAQTIASNPQLLLIIIVPLLLMYGVNYTLSTLLGKMLLPRGDAIAMVYGSVMRNLSIALAIAINAFGEQGSEAALVVAVAYIVQVQSAAWYVQLTDKFFGAPVSTDAVDASQSATSVQSAKPIAETE